MAVSGQIMDRISEEAMGGVYAWKVNMTAVEVLLSEHMDHHRTTVNTLLGHNSGELREEIVYARFLKLYLKKLVGCL